MIRVVMIVKNEAARLPALIEACGWADEIVAIDTGSTDETGKVLDAARPLVRWAPSKVFTAETPVADFRFNVARNEAIDFAAAKPGDWLVSMDADDQPTAGLGAQVQALAAGPAQCHGFRIHYGLLEFAQLRMWPHGHGIGWNAHHSCHEHLEVQGLPVVMHPDIVIVHPRENKPGRVSRNVAILERDYYARGYCDQRTLFYLGQAYRDAERWLEAAQFYRQYLAVGTWMEQRYFARLYLARCLARLPDLPAAWQAALTAVAEDPQRAESYCLLGDLTAGQGRKDQAACWYTMAISLGQPPAESKLFTERPCYRDYPLAQLTKMGALSDEVRQAV